MMMNVAFYNAYDSRFSCLESLRFQKLAQKAYDSRSLLIWTRNQLPLSGCFVFMCVLPYLYGDVSVGLSIDLSVGQLVGWSLNHANVWNTIKSKLFHHTSSANRFSFIYSFIHSFIHLSIHSFIHFSKKINHKRINNIHSNKSIIRIC